MAEGEGGVGVDGWAVDHVVVVGDWGMCVGGCVLVDEDAGGFFVGGAPAPVGAVRVVGDVEVIWVQERIGGG